MPPLKPSTKKKTTSTQPVGTAGDESTETSLPGVASAKAKAADPGGDTKTAFRAATLQELLRKASDFLRRSQELYIESYAKDRFRALLQRLSKNTMKLRRQRWAPSDKQDESAARPEANATGTEATSSTPGPGPVEIVDLTRELLEAFRSLLGLCYEHYTQGATIATELQLLAFEEGSDHFDFFSLSPDGEEESSSKSGGGGGGGVEPQAVVLLQRHLHCLRQDLAMKELILRHWTLAVEEYRSSSLSPPPPVPVVAVSSGGVRTTTVKEELEGLLEDADGANPPPPPPAAAAEIPTVGIDSAVMSSLDAETIRTYSYTIVSAGQLAPSLPSLRQQMDALVRWGVTGR